MPLNIDCMQWGGGFPAPPGLEQEWHPTNGPHDSFQEMVMHSWMLQRCEALRAVAAAPHLCGELAARTAMQAVQTGHSFWTYQDWLAGPSTSKHVRVAGKSDALSDTTAESRSDQDMAFSAAQPLVPDNAFLRPKLVSQLQELIGAIDVDMMCDVAGSNSCVEMFCAKGSPTRPDAFEVDLAAPGWVGRHTWWNPPLDLLDATLDHLLRFVDNTEVNFSVLVPGATPLPDEDVHLLNRHPRVRCVQTYRRGSDLFRVLDGGRTPRKVPKTVEQYRVLSTQRPH
mmetsp:Transcript_133668/g.303144  ORF Transcript_133668/g.303144 Transcript_133668/m.303144 type:complete len:283 (+) Transcript_133668:34-882(+)